MPSRPSEGRNVPRAATGVQEWTGMATWLDSRARPVTGGFALESTLSYISVNTEMVKKAMRVLVLGGSGFLGRHVVAAVDARGHDAIVGSREPAVRSMLP